MLQCAERQRQKAAKGRVAGLDLDYPVFGCDWNLVQVGKALDVIGADARRVQDRLDGRGIGVGMLDDTA